MKFRKETGAKDLPLRVISTLMSGEPESPREHEMPEGSLGADTVAHHHWRGRQGRLRSHGRNIRWHGKSGSLKLS